MTDQDLGGTERCGDETRVRAIELDKDGAACRQLDITTGCHTHREASDLEFSRVQDDGGGRSNNGDVVQWGGNDLAMIHESQAVRGGTRNTRLTRGACRTRSQRTRGTRRSRRSRAACRARRARSDGTRESRETRGTKGAAEFQGAQDGTRVEAPCGDGVTSDDLKTVIIKTELHRFVNGLNGESLCRVGGLADDGLNVTDGGGDAIKHAIELDEDRGACLYGDITIACDPHGVAAGDQIGGDDGLRGISEGDLGNGRDGLANGLLKGHESETVRRGTRVARDTCLTRRARQFYRVNEEACVGACCAPGRDPVALNEIHGIPVGARYGFVNGLNGESLRHLGAPADDRLDASDSHARAAWAEGTIQLDTHDGAHARGDISVGGDADGAADGV